MSRGQVFLDAQGAAAVIGVSDERPQGTVFNIEGDFEKTPPFAGQNARFSADS